MSFLHIQLYKDTNEVADWQPNPDAVPEDID